MLAQPTDSNVEPDSSTGIHLPLDLVITHIMDIDITPNCSRTLYPNKALCNQPLIIIKSSLAYTEAFSYRISLLVLHICVFLEQVFLVYIGEVVGVVLTEMQYLKSII